MNESFTLLKIEGRTGEDPRDSAEGYRNFRNALGQFATGVTVMTGFSPNGDRFGITVTSFNSLSLDPPLILWSLGREGGSFACFQAGTPFAVNVLSSGQKDMAERFARVGIPKFEGVATQNGLDGVPLIAGASAYFECLVEARYPGGDHDIVVGRVRRLFNIGKDPLLFHKGALRPLG
ncbi:MAG: flavin reductase family protein [Rhodospirillaceae bacterium]|nr:flavin reductase family protein [Rhodospirillaceae bacterium]